MKRLLCIVGGMNAGGAETFLMKVYRMLDTTKYQMDFAVAITEKGYYDDEISQRGGIIYHITPKSKGLIKNFNSIRKLVKENQYEYVLRTSQHSLSALELLAARMGGARVRAFRSSNSNTTSGSKKQMLLHKMCSFMPKWFANVRIAPSTEAAEFMFGKACINKGRAKLLHNGIDLSVYRYDESGRISVREDLGVSDTTLLVGHVGRFNQQKNHAFLLEIFKRIHDEHDNSILLLVGKGELEDHIRERVIALGLEEYVIFTGVRSDVPRLLSAMDVFLMPSFYEGMPNTVIEAQAAGLPCVIADTITKEADITGLVNYLPLGDVDLWAEKALAVINSSRAETYSSFIEHYYDINSVTEDFIKLIFRTNKSDNASD